MKNKSIIKHFLSAVITIIVIAAFCYIGYKMNLSYMLDSNEPDWLSFGISLLFASSCFATLFFLRKFIAVRITLMSFSILTLFGILCYLIKIFQYLVFFTLISFQSVFGLTKIFFFFTAKPNNTAYLMLLIGFFVAILICSVLLSIEESQRRKLNQLRPESV